MWYLPLAQVPVGWHVAGAETIRRPGPRPRSADPDTSGVYRCRRRSSRRDAVCSRWKARRSVGYALPSMGPRTAPRRDPGTLVTNPQEVSGSIRDRLHLSIASSHIKDGIPSEPAMRRPWPLGGGRSRHRQVPCGCGTLCQALGGVLAKWFRNRGGFVSGLAGHP